jgi:hypothetical protein
VKTAFRSGYSKHDRVRRLCYLRSPRKVNHYLWVFVERQPSGSVLAVISPDRSKSVRGGVGQILILDAYVFTPLSVFPQSNLLDIGYSHPSMPPLPVARNRPVQFSGSQASNEILESLEVFIDSAIRHRLAEIAWEPRLQVASLSGNASFVPAGTYLRTLRVASVMRSSG